MCRLFLGLNLSVTFQNNSSIQQVVCYFASHCLVSNSLLNNVFVTQVLNMLCCWVEDPNSEAFKLHLPRLYDYLWLAQDGMKMQVLNNDFTIYLTSLYYTICVIIYIQYITIISMIICGL